jgi:valyl-tRNA synthetase
MPFVTEEIWQKLPHHPDWDRPVSLTVAKFPLANQLQRFPEAAGKWSLVQSLVSEIRSVRSQSGIAPKLPLKAFVRTSDDLADLFDGAATDICRLASLGELNSGSNVTRPGQSLAAVGRGFEAFIPAEGIVDIAKEQTRLKSEAARISKILTGIEAKLANPNFTDRAPAEVLEQTKAQRDNMRFQLESLQKNLETLS